MSEEAPVFENVKYDTSAPVVDREQMQMLLMSDDPEELAMLAGELFDLFVSESEEKMTDMDRACEEGDAVVFRKIVHFIAGSAGNLGVLRLSSFLRGIEKSIDDESLVDFVACGKIVRSEFETSCGVFKAEFGL